MRPLTVINLIILGSSFAIMTSLTAVIVVVLVLGDEYPRLQYEFDALLASFALFAGLTALSATSFYSLLKNHRAWPYAQCGMWGGVAVAVWYYWP